MHFYFVRDIRKELSCSISSGAKRHKLMASLRLELEESSVSWASGAHGRATRATCVRGIFILEEEIQRWKRRQQGRCRLADWAQGWRLRRPCAIEATIFPTPIRVPKKAAIVKPTEHLKIAGQLQCWAKGCPLSPLSYNSILYFLGGGKRGFLGGERGNTFACPLF